MISDSLVHNANMLMHFFLRSLITFQVKKKALVLFPDFICSAELTGKSYYTKFIKEILKSRYHYCIMLVHVDFIKMENRA